MAAKYIGKPVKRTEDPRLVQGLGTYVDDLRLPEMGYCAILRSPHAHARIRKLDLKKARNHSGVIEAIDGRQARDACGTVPCAAALEGLKVPTKYTMAVDKTVFSGEPVAAVVADDPYTARDALELIEVDYEPLPAITDAREAAARKSPLIYPELKTNVAYRWTLEGGDVDAAFEKADLVVSQPLVNQRLIPIAMEPRGVLASYHRGEGQLKLWSSTQIPHLMRTQVAIMLGLAENLVRVITPEVGGGFGSKLNVYAEEAIVGHLAIKTGRPVKWIETRRENMAATIHGRHQEGVAELAVRKSGRILGIRYTIYADLGAYFQLLTPAIPTLTGLVITGPYDIPTARMDVTGVLTNKMATDAYRGAGRPEATFVVERLVDMAARRLGIEPTEMRRKNYPRKFPYTTATQLVYDSGDYEAPLDKALKMAGYKALRKRQEKLRKRGRLIGIGLSSYVEICALGPSPAMPAGGWESATVRIDPTGKVTVLTGASPHGQGQHTSFAQIAAEMLGVDMADVRVIHGDTGIVQYGIGTFGSRATAVGGTAVVQAVEQLLDKGTSMAATLLGVKPASVEFSAGVFRVKKSPRKRVTIQDVALEAYTAKNISGTTEPGLAATSFYEPANFTFPFGTHVCAVEVDRHTGRVTIDRYVAVDDCGNVVNPLLVDGQIHGGIVQSLGQALLEAGVYDESGQLLTGTLMDYAIPRAHDVPWIETGRTVTPSPVNPLGVKGVGEAGTIGATPAFVNAVVDALAPLGVEHLDMPLTAHRIWHAISNGEAS